MIVNQSFKPCFLTAAGTNSGQSCKKEQLRPHIANLVGKSDKRGRIAFSFQASESRDIPERRRLR